MRKPFTYRSILPVIAGAITLFAIACGGGGEPAATATSRPAATPTATTVPATSTSAGLTGNATVGAELFVSETCSACHSTGENSIVGPGLKGVSVRAEAHGGDAYLFESITDRNAVVVEGYSPVMSDFSHLDDQTVADLVAYLKTLN